MKRTEKISPLRAGVELRLLVGKYSGSPITNALNLIVQRTDCDSDPTVIIKTCRKALAEAMQIVRRTELKKGPVGPSFDDSLNRLEKAFEDDEEEEEEDYEDEDDYEEEDDEY